MFESIEFTINPHFMLSDLKPFLYICCNLKYLI